MKTSDSVIIDGYDLLAENERLGGLPGHEIAGRRLNRATARVSPEGTPHASYEQVKREHMERVLPNTLDQECPVVDLTYPVSGMFADSPAGVYLDLYQGVAQKVVDERHPVFERTIRLMVEHGLAFRREINTDDFLCMSHSVPGLHTAAQLAGLANDLMAERFGGKAPYKTFFSNSGAEAGEAAIKLGQIHAYRRFLAKHGPEVLAHVMQDLGIDRIDDFDTDAHAMPDALYADYPFFVFGCQGAFHGRTLGVLNLTRSKKAQRLGFSTARWFKHIPYNGHADDLTRLIDRRPITEILDVPGGVSGVIAAGQVPVDLAALFAVECYQGEGGYRIADRAWLRSIHQACEERGILFGCDEVQTFGRTGTLFAVEHYDIEPDVLWISKGAVVGLTLARAELGDACHVGWHSNTFGGGKFFDVNMAYAVLETLTRHEDPVFEGRTYLDNSRIKGEYVRMRLADLSARHPTLFPGFSGLGGMWGLTVRWREEIIQTGWRMGIKLLGCGWKGELSRIRILLLADVLTREIDEMIAALDRTFAVVERQHADELPATQSSVKA